MYFFFCERTVNRTNYPLILNIIYSMNDGNNFSCEFINRLVYSENIRILFLAIRRKNAFNVSVINRIINIPVFWMITFERSVNCYFNNISNHLYLRKFRFIFPKV